MTHRYKNVAGPRVRWHWLLTLTCCALSAASSVRASDALAVGSAAFPALDIGTHAAVMIDQEGRWSTEEVLGGAAAPAFVPATASNTELGFTGAIVWLRFAVSYAAGLRSPAMLVLPKPLLDEVTLFTLGADGAASAVVTGDAQPFASRPLSYRGFAFPLQPRAGATVTYYLRVHSPNSGIGLPLTLLSVADFQALAATENYVLGGYAGFMCGLLVCALVLLVFARQPEFAYYALYLATFTLLLIAINGYGMQFLWPDSPVAQQHLPTWLCALCIVSGIAFVHRFLDLPRTMPWTELPLGFAVGSTVLGVILHGLVPSPIGTKLVVATGVLMCPVVLVIGLRAAAAGERIARYLLVGWIAYVVGVVVAALDATALIATTPWTTYGMCLGSLAEFVALAIGLADRLRHLQRERAAQLVAVNADLASLNANLEQIVQARTSELEVRNRELGELAVRDSLTGLYNHSTTIELLDQLLQQSQRYEFPVATIMVDLDNFKQLNDTWGHQLGDQILEQVSLTLAESVRGADIVGRYGGEEFLIAMSHADSLAAREYGERLLQLIRDIKIGAAELSASIGTTNRLGQGQRHLL